MFYGKLWSQTANAFVSGYSYGPFLQTTIHLDENTLKPVSISPNGRQLISSMSLCHFEKSQSVYPQQRSSGSFGCYYFSTPSPGNWLEPGDKDRTRKNRTCSYYKSEEYDITEVKVDSLPSPDGINEAVLVEGDMQEAVPWWQNFPKRWVIVLFCFAAFLLCNMDCVNTSIAILPMSKEFNWNSATVGLIQSSFFWGYLLTQSLEGIWADKIGGKLVLGFGVVWWSVATILTPIAARIGLPFLLIMRAFMGIGKAYSSPKEDPELSKEEKKLIMGGRLSKEPVKVLKFNLTQSGLLCVLPWLTMAAFANIGGWIADTLVSKGLSITAVWKIMQSIGFLGPAFFLTQLSHVRTPALAVLCMARSQGSDAFSQSGLYSNTKTLAHAMLEFY